jgi:hypothetical protein
MFYILIVIVRERRDMRSSSVLERRGPRAPSVLLLSVLSWLVIEVENLWGTRDVTAGIVTQ